MKTRINITVDKSVLEEFDGIIGIAKRSTYINNLMKKETLDLKNQCNVVIIK